MGITASAGAAKSRDREVVHRFQLQPDLQAKVDSEGGLFLLQNGLSEPLLTTEVISPVDVRRRRGSDTFHSVVTEGAKGGGRGFSSLADDDQDGLTDEDPLDGLDNDQDGKIDEDFAAISDAMVAVRLGDRTAGDRGQYLEYFHWENARLSPAIFLNVGGNDGGYRIQSPGGAWQISEINTLRHTLSGQPVQEKATALVCPVRTDDLFFDLDPCAPGSVRWLGVMILEQKSPARFVLDDTKLELALDDKTIPLVICAADSWTQLNRILGDALKVYAGVTDPVDNRQARWIITPACTACRSARPPEFHLQTGPGDDLTLSVEVAPGQCGLLDPDLFWVAGKRLGIPQRIRWTPNGGKPTDFAWTCMTADRLKEGSAPGSLAVLSELQAHQAEGRLDFHFASSREISDRDPGKTLTVVGRYFDGRTLESVLADESPSEAETPATIAGRSSSRDSESEAVEQAALRFAEDRARLLNEGSSQPNLSADLLMGWPNPFNDAISIRFTVPSTMRQAFVWKDGQDTPAEFDLESEVPWSGGQPNVSVKIYSINGQELVTLHSASVGAGEYTVHWNGTDAFGRKVASGTYFCKLQLDDWSVTRRLVFIR